MEYIKLNNNEEHLSLGNLFRIIKELSKNKSGALQIELFSILFDGVNVNSTTINNYCVGLRSINDDYKQIMLNKEKRYQKNEKEFLNNILGILSIMDGHIYIEESINFINKSENIILLAKKLYNIAKNDETVLIDFEQELLELLKNNKYYECLVKEIIYVVLYKKQPIYISEQKKELIENILNDTNISSNELSEYLNLKLKESINYNYNLKKMAEKNNPLANYEIGSNYLLGIYGNIDYEKAYYYFYNASLKKHVGSLYMLGNMFLKGYVGGKTNDDLKLAYDYLNEAAKLGSISALNKIGNMFLNGIYPLKKDKNMAIKYYEDAIKHDYVYSYNNLGKIYEEEGNKEKAYELYLKSANLGESWAANKMGEYYRMNNDMENAFKYYNIAIDNNDKDICYYAYYNLAKYFYKNGYKNIVLIKDENLANEYFNKAKENGILIDPNLTN